MYVPSSELGPPSLPRKRVCLPPWTQRDMRSNTRLRVRGWGGTQFRRSGRHSGTLYTLWYFFQKYSLSSLWYPHKRIAERIQKVARHSSYKKRLEQRCIHEKGIVKGTYLVLNRLVFQVNKLNSSVLVNSRTRIIERGLEEQCLGPWPPPPVSWQHSLPHSYSFFVLCIRHVYTLPF